MLGRRNPDDPLHVLTPARTRRARRDGGGQVERRHRETLFVGEATVEKHVTAIFRKLGIAPATTEHRRVHAVLRYLHGTAGRH